tara:strand:- start:2818 stop:2967 length:150 start_codon:yes stop_codon:yes gene_type:complete
MAFDCRTRYFNDSKKAAVVAELKKSLGAHFNVIVHTTHVHVGYKPMRVE